MKRLLSLAVVCVVVNGGVALAVSGGVAGPLERERGTAVVPDGAVMVTLNGAERPVRSWAGDTVSTVQMPLLRSSLNAGQSVREAIGSLTALDGRALALDLAGYASAGDGEEVEEASEEASESTETYRNLAVLADLNGDGTPEVATSSYTWPTGIGSTEVRDGRTGAVVWVAPDASDSSLEVLGDVDGDGVVDLLGMTIGVDVAVDEETCDGESCTYRLVFDLNSEIAVLDGSTGHVLWADAAPGSYSVTIEQSFADGNDVYRFSEAIDLLLGEVGGDHDGDSTPEVLISRLDQAYTYDYSSTDTTTGLGLLNDIAEEDSLTGTVDARVVAGASGATLLQLAAGGDSQVAMAEAMLGDVNGDGADDLQVMTTTVTPVNRRCRRVAVLPQLCSQDQRASARLTVEAVDGRDGGSLWTTAFDGFGFSIGGADLDNDGTQDLMVLGQSGGYTTSVVSGRTGAAVWSRTEADWLFPLQREDLDGDGDLDLVTVSLIEDPETYAWSIAISRMDAATGVTWLETHPVDTSDAGDCSFGMIYIAGGAHDLDGDGPADPWGGSLVQDYGPGCEGPETETSMAFVESGRSGEMIHLQSSDTLTVTSVVDDLSGDGAADTIRQDLFGGPSEASTGWDGPVLWTAPADGSYVYSLGVDLDGIAGGDVIGFRVVETDTGYDEILSVRSGRNFALRWQVGGE